MILSKWVVFIAAAADWTPAHQLGGQAGLMIDRPPSQTGIYPAASGYRQPQHAQHQPPSQPWTPMTGDDRQALQIGEQILQGVPAMQSPKKEPAKEAAYQNYLAQEKELADAQRRAQEQEFAYKQKLNAQEAELIAMHAREAQKHRSSLQTEYRAAKEREESKRPNKREVGVLYQVNPQFTEDQLRAVRLHTGLSPPDMKPVIGDFGLVSQASALPVERIGGAQMQPGQIASLAHGPSPAQTGVSNAERSLLQACNPVEVDKVFTVWLRAIKEAAFNY